MEDYSVGLALEMNCISEGLAQVQSRQYNTILYLNQAQGNVIKDKEGNYAIETLAPLKVQARLLPDKDNNDTVLNEGNDFIRTYMTGYLQTPMNLDGNYHLWIKCKLFNDNQWIYGKFMIIPELETSLEGRYGLRRTFGQKIKGWWQRTPEQM